MNKYNKQIEIFTPYIKNNISDCVYLKQVNIEYEKKIVKLLSQKDLANGWRQVLPFPKSTLKIIERNSKLINRKIKYYIVQKINLSQLNYSHNEQTRKIYYGFGQTFEKR